MNSDENFRMGRREALKWVGTALVVFPLLEWEGFSAETAIKRTLTDPDLLHPGKLWDRILTRDELRTVSILCDLIIPADGRSGAASKVGVPDFIDEWVSAPYPVQQADQKTIRNGLTWLDAEATKRFSKSFASLSEQEMTAICDDICFVPKAKDEFKAGAEFFARMRDLTATGFYTTKEGMKDLRYIGNVPLTSFTGPPKEVLEYLKLT